ncbi:TPA: hypothetical protein ACGSTL_001382 [Vibrio parahaemolyticus]|uniref:hypothetical protein n=1 Tax=Vibrio campbellii TaxID=680 RepID=UPI001F071CAC|nr:hypothetical protein [Vibrio campbellii]UMM06827.1 hypothetical protein MKR81_26565 [Vibrio campbellii]
MITKFKLVALSVKAALTISDSSAKEKTSKSKRFKTGFKLITVGTFIALTAPAYSEPATRAQTEHWQQDIQAQLKKQLGESMSSANSKRYISDERMAELQEQARMLATQDGAFTRHQIGRFCKLEINTFCKGRGVTDPMLGTCLAKHEDQLSPQCKTVTSDGFRGEPTKGDAYYHDVLIPARSQYFYLPNDRSVGVKLYRPTTFKGLQIKTEITWYEGGSIRSYIPAVNPVKYEYLTFAPNKKLVFFPNGKVKQGVLFQSIEIGNQHFPAGVKIYRASPLSQWSIGH